MDKAKFLKLSVSEISQVYSGKQECCRCGCGGDYVSTSYAVNPRSEVDNSLVLKRLKRAQKLVLRGADVEVLDGVCYEVQTGVDRCLTFYVEKSELKAA